MNHPIENIMQTSMEHIKALADVNTVIGTPIMTDDETMILPVSKVTLGMLVGGGEYEASNGAKKDRFDATNGKFPFIGASTLGMSLTPLAFLSVSNGAVRVLPAKQDCPTDRLIEMIPHVMETAERIITELSDDGSKAHGRCGCSQKPRVKTEKEREESPFRYEVEYEPHEDEMK